MFSNTFLIERQLQWSGLMIEAEPNNFKSLLEKKRNAALVPACLSLATKPKMLPFLLEHGPISKIDQSSQNSVQVQCLPLYSILLALNRTTIDLFCLDIEGHELDVLRTIPFDKVDIKVRFAE
jgi:FkbM family methyltransferase